MSELDTDRILVRKFTVGPFQENAYLVGCPETGDAIFVDPGDEADRLIAAVEESGLELRAIWNTHAHIDHVGAVEPIKKRFGVPFLLHSLEEPLLDQVSMQAALFGLVPPERPVLDRTIEEGEELVVGRLSFRVLFVPGHSPGHVAFLGSGNVFSGDCLFAGSIGRTDLPGGDHGTLIASIQRELLPLDDEIAVHAGHLGPTTIGQERRLNPFLQAI